MRRAAMTRRLSVFLPIFLLTALLAASPAMTAQRDELHGNASSRIYHNSGCRHYDCRRCTVRFSSAAEAIRAGFRACKVCGG